MAGEQTVSGHITWKQQAGSVLQQRKIFRSSPTTRRSHFIWPGGCGQWTDTFPTVRVGYAVIHLSIAPSHTFSIFHPLFCLLWQTFPFLYILSSSFLLHFLCFSCFSSCSSFLSFLLSNLTSSCFCLFRPPPPTFPIKLSHSSLSHPLSLSVCGQSHLI